MAVAASWMIASPVGVMSDWSQSKKTRYSVRISGAGAAGAAAGVSAVGQGTGKLLLTTKSLEEWTGSPVPSTTGLQLSLSCACAPLAITMGSARAASRTVTRRFIPETPFWFGNDKIYRTHRTALLAISRLTRVARSEEHTSELQSLMRISYAVFCLKKKK